VAVFLAAAFFVVVFLTVVVRRWVDDFFACWAIADEENEMSAISTITSNSLNETLFIIEP
jgi:hypothetical protein